MSDIAMMPAGTYYVGDLCYVMHDEWDEFCSLTIKDNKCLQGKFALKDGREFVTFQTAWGDGEYYDQFSRPYLVDAGLIGCIKLNECNRLSIDHVSGGQVMTFDREFLCKAEDGVLTFGNVVIDTDSDPDEDDY